MGFLINRSKHAPNSWNRIGKCSNLYEMRGFWNRVLRKIESLTRQCWEKESRMEMRRFLEVKWCREMRKMVVLLEGNEIWEKQRAPTKIEADDPIPFVVLVRVSLSEK